MKVSRFVAALLLALPISSQAEPQTSKVVERYKQMLAANPVEGIALDRLWKGALDAGTTEDLLASYAQDESFPGQMVLGHLRRKAGRDDDAAKAYTRAATIDPKSPLPLLALAKLETGRTHPREAAAWLEKAAALLPDNDPQKPEALLQLGAAWLAAGESAKAAAAWEHTVKLDPGNLDLRRRLATAYTDHSLPELAITHLEVIVERGPAADRVAALQQIGRLHSSAGNPGAAMKALEKAVSQTAPGHWLRAEMLGQMIRIAQRQKVEADLEAKWKQQVEQSPRDLGAYLQLVEFYEQTGQLELQRDWLEKVIALVPKSAEYRLKLARLLVQLDQWEQAAALYDALLAAQPRNADLVFERARLDLQRDQGEQARLRLAALLAAKKDDDLLRARVLEFYQAHHLHALAGQHLQADAAAGTDEAVFALAVHYFAQRNVPEGLDTLRRLARPGDPPERRAALAFRTAQLLKAQGELAESVSAVEAALAAQPDTREFLLLLGDLQNTRARYPEARAAYTKAYALGATDAERQEADGRIFQSIREEHSAPAAPPTGGPSTRGLLPRRNEPAQAAVEDHIRSLMTEATNRKTADAWLRVARWKAWNGDKASAVTFANKASEMDPKNAAPHEFLARHSAANGDPAFALVHLGQLLELNPAGRPGYEREIAQLELQRGNTREALAAYARIAKANPGDVTALTELAGALERARKLEDAAATWRKVLALLPAPRKREASTSILRVLKELGNHDEACQMLLLAVDETPVDRERLARFDELLLYAQQQGRLPWLRAKFEERRKTRADDYFTGVALGRVLKILGEKNAAFELFADAALSAPRQADALPELIREAEELQRLDTAVRLQEQYTRLAPQEGPDGFIKLAALCERTGDLEGAERAWTRAASKFPRDVEVLRRAANFHQDWGDPSRAAALLRKLHSVEPGNAHVAATLGAVEFRAGRLEEARQAFEAVMRLTKVVTQRIYPGDTTDAVVTEGGPRRMNRRTGVASAGEPFHFSTTPAFPSFPKTHSLGGYAAGKTEPDAEIRLGSLRRLAEIARQRGGPDLLRWRADWESAPDGTEALWALYFAGSRPAVLDRIEQRITAQPQEPVHRQAWIWIALESGEYSRLAAWLNAPLVTAPDLDLFTQAFAEFVRTRPSAVGPAMIAGLFPPGMHTRTSQSAVALSDARHYAEAISLGRRVFERAGSQRPNIGRDLARMHLAAGQPSEALRVLEQAAHAEGDWFGSPVYEAMRDYCLLANAGQRTQFIRQKLETAHPRTVHGLLTQVTLHGLEGRLENATAALDALLDMRAMAGSGAGQAETAGRQWEFYIDASNHLTSWALPALAEHLWDRVFDDPAFLALQAKRAQKLPTQSDEELPTLVALMETARTLRDALRFRTGDAVDRAEILGARLPFHGKLDRLSDLLEAHRASDAAVAVARYTWEQAPNNPSTLRRLMDTCRAADDSVTAELVRQRVLSERLNPGNDSTPVEFAEELSRQLEERGDFAGALRILDEARAAAPMVLSLQVRHARLLQLSGAGEDAIKTLLDKLATDTGDAYTREQVAQMLQRQGKASEALAFRSRSGGADPQLPLLLYQVGETDEARAAVDKLPGSYAVFAAMTLAEAMALRGDARSARSVLVTAAGRITDPRSQLQLRSKLLRLPGAPPTPQFAARMEARMRAIIEAQPALADLFYEFFDRHAEKLGIGADWIQSATQAWAGGKGPLPAGLSVLRARLAASDAPGARTACEHIAARVDLTDAILARASSLVAAARRDDLRLFLAETAARRGWPDSQPTLAWVSLLGGLGQGEKARAVLESHHWLVMFENGAQTLGREWLQLGDVERARHYTQQALSQAAVEPSPSLLAQMARVHLASRRPTAARLLLRRAFQVPSCREYDALAACLDAAGELPRWREAIAEFALPPSSQHGLKLALFSLFEKQGRVAEAIALVVSEPELISPSGDYDHPPGAITCPRLRALAKKTGAFGEVEKLFTGLLNARLPGAEAELAALRADRAETTGELPFLESHIERAATLAPSTWEFARRRAELLQKSGQWSKARDVLARYLSTPGKPTDREAAFEMWDRK